MIANKEQILEKVRKSDEKNRRKSGSALPDVEVNLVEIDPDFYFEPETPFFSTKVTEEDIVEKLNMMTPHQLL